MKELKTDMLPIGFEVKQLVGLSWETLQHLFKQMNGKPLNKEELPKWKMILGFVNATNNSVKTSLQCVKFVTLPLAVKEMKKAMKQKHKR
jgi:hypothetical protein